MVVTQRLINVMYVVEITLPVRTVLEYLTVTAGEVTAAV